MYSYITQAAGFPVFVASQCPLVACVYAKYRYLVRLRLWMAVRCRSFEAISGASLCAYASFYVTSSKVVMCFEGFMALVLPICACGAVAVGACALYYNHRCNQFLAIGFACICHKFWKLSSALVCNAF